MNHLHIAFYQPKPNCKRGEKKRKKKINKYKTAVWSTQNHYGAVIILILTREKKNNNTHTNIYIYIVEQWKVVNQKLHVLKQWKQRHSIEKWETRSSESFFVCFCFFSEKSHHGYCTHLDLYNIFFKSFPWKFFMHRIFSQSAEWKKNRIKKKMKEKKYLYAHASRTFIINSSPNFISVPVCHKWAINSYYMHFNKRKYIYICEDHNMWDGEKSKNTVKLSFCSLHEEKPVFLFKINLIYNFAYTG